MDDDTKEKQPLQQSSSVTNENHHHIAIELQNENATLKLNDLLNNVDLDETTLTNSTRRTRPLCGSSKNKEIINTISNNNKSDKTCLEMKEEIQLKSLNSQTNNSKTNNQVKIDLNDDHLIINGKENQNKKACCKKKSSSSSPVNISSSKDDLSEIEKISNCKQIGKMIKRLIPCLVAWTILVGSTGSYFAFVAIELLSIMENNLIYWIVLIMIQSLIFLYVVVNFLIAILRDPGRFEKVIISSDDPNFNDDAKSPLYKTIKIQKAQVKIKWCSVSLLLLCNFTFSQIFNY